MTKFIVLTLLILCFSFIINAQESSSKNILNRFELVLGSSLSNNSGYLNEYDSKVGYSIGLGYYQKLSNSFSFNLRSFYETKGSAATYNYTLSDGIDNYELTDTYTTQFKYLTFNLLPTLQLGRNKNIYLSAGGYYSFLLGLSVNTYTTNRETNEFFSEHTNTDKNYFDPTFDAGVNMLVGYSFKISDKSQLMFQVFCNRGLVDLYNPKFGSQRNNAFGLMSSFRFL